jgi:hypothetical protein
MVMSGSYMREFSVSKDMIKIDNDKMRKEVVVRKLPEHLCLTLYIKELKISVEQDRVVTTLNIIFSVVNKQTPFIVALMKGRAYYQGRYTENVENRLI